MTLTKTDFLLGPGYVGREIIDRLRALSSYRITTVVRREATTVEFKTDGVNAVMGDLDDSVLIQKLAEESDIVFHTATATHSALSSGHLQRNRSPSKETVYLHQSGASCLDDDSKSVFLNETIYTDASSDQIDALPDTASHRVIDLVILETRKAVGSKGKIFIMIPPIIYGVNERLKTPRLWVQMPTLTRYALQHVRAAHVGKGLAAWGTVHVLDPVEADMLILQWLLTSDSSALSTQPYFFCENGEATWSQIARMIGKHLHNAGRVESPMPREILTELFGDLFGAFSYVAAGGNCCCCADQLREIG